MTFPDLVRALLRWWPVLLIGILCTPAVGYLTISDKGAYFSRTEIVFLAPTSSLYPNALRTQSEDIIDTAGVVAKRITGPGEVSKFASPDVTLVGMGVRDGWSLRLPDTGGQWGTNFATQRLVLDVVAPDPGTVQRRQVDLVARVRGELATLQRDAGVAPVNSITVTAAPETPVVYHIGGSKYRVLGMTAALGAGLTVGTVLLLECRRRRNVALGGVSRRSRKAKSPSQSGSDRRLPVG